MAQLGQMGISAALLNSSISPVQQSRVIEKARAGEYRLLYLSPERLAREDTIEWLQGVPILFFAIDEAHCISEWGHEFRPEYRQLSRLRAHFPDRAIAAFTASATQRVRHDIIRQLELREPHKYIASFHRPNLRYVVRACDAHSQTELLTARDAQLRKRKHHRLRAHDRDSGIHRGPSSGKRNPRHCLSRPDERRRSQTQSGALDGGRSARDGGHDRVRPGHQQSRRARRDPSLAARNPSSSFTRRRGAPGATASRRIACFSGRRETRVCTPTSSARSTIQEEKERAWQRYHEIRGFVESDICRHQRICGHFGENKKWTSCGACDVCGYEPAWLSAPVEEPRRRRKRSRSRSAAPAAPAPARQSWERPAPAPAPARCRSYPIWTRTCANSCASGEGKQRTSKMFRPFVVMHDTTLDEICRVNARLDCAACCKSPASASARPNCTARRFSTR